MNKQRLQSSSSDESMEYIEYEEEEEETPISVRKSGDIKHLINSNHHNNYNV